MYLYIYVLQPFSKTAKQEEFLTFKENKISKSWCCKSAFRVFVASFTNFKTAVLYHVKTERWLDR